jgi:hypothetical protein
MCRLPSRLIGTDRGDRSPAEGQKVMRHGFLVADGADNPEIFHGEGAPSTTGRGSGALSLMFH